MRASRATERIVILTGAGISVESGLPTFRGASGLWAGFRLEEVATPEAYARDPQTVLRFYDLRRRQLLEAGIAPNPAHLALAELERRFPGEVLLVTQNIDDLHERAGSTNLIHMHGELLKVRCTVCPAVLRWEDDLSRATSAPAAGGPTRCGRTSSGSARCRSSWTGSTARWTAATCSSRSAPRATSTRPRASSRR